MRLSLIHIYYEHTKFEDVAAVVVASYFVPWGFSTLIMMRDVGVTYPEPVSYTHLDVYKRQTLYSFVINLSIGKVTISRRFDKKYCQFLR